MCGRLRSHLLGLHASSSLLVGGLKKDVFRSRMEDFVSGINKIQGEEEQGEDEQRLQFCRRPQGLSLLCDITPIIGHPNILISRRIIRWSHGQVWARLGSNQRCVRVKMERTSKDCSLRDAAIES